LRVEQQRLFRRHVPRVAEMIVAVSPAELPERGEPWRGVARLYGRARRDQPALHRLLQEAVLQEPLAGGPGQLARSEHAGSVELELTQLLQRGGKLFIRGGHGGVRGGAPVGGVAAATAEKG